MNRSSAHQKQDSFHFSLFSLNLKFSRGLWRCACFCVVSARVFKREESRTPQTGLFSLSTLFTEFKVFQGVSGGVRVFVW